MGDSLVSIVLPTYARPSMLPRAISSVSEQTHENWELLVVDDNPPESSDRSTTEELMKRYRADARIRHVCHESNRGGSAARNTGIREATGEFVAFLDDDDQWRPRKLELQLQAIGGSGADTALVYTGYDKVYDDGDRVVTVRPARRGELLDSLLAGRNFIGTTSTVLCRREALLDVGLFDESLPASQDYDLYVRLAKRYRIEVVPDPLVISYRHGGTRISSDPVAKANAADAFYRKHEGLLKQNPDRHLAFLKTQMVEQFEFGLSAQVRKTAARARSISPFDPQVILFSLIAGLGPTVLRGRRRLSGLRGSVRGYLRSTFR